VRTRMRVPTDYDFTAIIDFHGIRAVVPHKHNSNTQSQVDCMACNFGRSLSISFSSGERVSCPMAAYAITSTSNFLPMTYHFSSSDVCKQQHMHVMFGNTVHIRRLLAGMTWKGAANSTVT
jgi:hypothetical protein